MPDPDREPLNNLPLSLIEADIAQDGYIELVDHGGFDGHSFRLIKGSYEIAESTIWRLLDRGLLEPFANGGGYRKRRVQPSADGPTVPTAAASESLSSGVPG